MRTIIRPRAAALLVGGALTLGLAVPAGAQTTTSSASTVASLHQRCDAAISRRLVTLNRLAQRVAGAKHLTSADRSTLATQLSSATSGLTSLKAKIDADADPATVRADCREIVSAYRVYLLVEPRTHEVLAADAELAAADLLSNDVGPKLQSKIDAAKAAGKDTAAAQAALDDLKAKAASARTTAQSVPASVLPLTPGDYNAGRAKPVLEAARSSLRSGRVALRAAALDARTERRDVS